MPGANTQLSLILIFASLVAIGAIEGFFLTRSRSYDWREFGVSTLDLLIRLGILLTIRSSVLTPILPFLEAHRLGNIEMNGWWQWLALFVVVDFCYYVLHRSCHEIRWFWAYHAPHHTSQEITIAAGYRLGFFEKLLGLPIFYVFAYLIGFAPPLIEAMITTTAVYQCLIHLQWVRKLGWLEYIFNTPSNHRVHHALNPQYRNKNFGGALIIFDRIFGTYVQEQEVCVYKTENMKPEYNAFRVEFRELLIMLKGFSKWREPRAVLTHVFGSPFKGDE